MGWECLSSPVTKAGEKYHRNFEPNRMLSWV